MVDELGSRERRYIEAYLELESHSSAAHGLRERVIAAAFAEAEPAGSRRRSPRRRALLLAGVGLCAASALAWWVGRTSLVEAPAARLPDQAPLIMRSDRPVHETSAVKRGDAKDRGAPEAVPEVAADVAPAASSTSAAPERTRPRATPAPVVPRVTERRPTPPRKPPEAAAPTLSTAEVALLDRARRLAQHGQHEAALARLREHASTYPRSVLATERAAEEVAVLCRMGSAAAESARASFLAGDPPQYLRVRVTKACPP
ncbi:hypothetical protein [Paraliomyxa miuraensis]|uniref:hypothetical protein n=1 Tax=Paraliomyxa miuraensis TaxID=376150 RepID=UPI0022521A42|nr:hypothetical protein [Paraliomyxa miuraensis]MCX4246351.1 hypothetical protein [Paraliomyxa miuraensis]